MLLTNLLHESTYCFCSILKNIDLTNPPKGQFLPIFPVKASFCFAVFDAVAFVVEFFTASKANVHFGIAVFVDINGKWHDGKAFFLNLL